MIIYSGVPQGGVISPILFKNNTNDIYPNIDIQSEINLFADDETKKTQ